MPNDSLTLVQDYREHLAKYWGIEPALTVDEVYARLSRSDANELRRWRKKLTQTSAPQTLDFYAWASTQPPWMAKNARFGPIHSQKWMEILASGVWAATVLEELAPDGPLLDLGCNAGYWTSWVSGLRTYPATGVDWSEPSIRYGQRRLTEAGLPGELRIADFTSLPPHEQYPVVVSLQGLTSWWRDGDIRTVAKVAALTQEDGYFLSVDEWPDDLDSFGRSMCDAGFSLYAFGLVGGLLLNEEWGMYRAALFKRDGGRGSSISDATTLTEALWADFYGWANAEQMDWTKQNTAYWPGAEGRLIAVVL